LIISLTGIAGSSQVGDYVTMGGQCGVAGHVKIGDKAILAARTGVTNSIVGDQVYSGRPAIPIRDDMKMQALVRRLPKLVARIKALEDK
jgi:UDP-3-O-[3-hydroxymyristoyl] glucosamine N-acyltransferase